MSSRSESRTVIGRHLFRLAPIRGFAAYFPFLILIAASICGCLGEQETTGHSSSPPGILLDYHRTGGIAGFDDYLIVFENGESVISTRQGSGTFNLNPDSLKKIKDLLDLANFTALNASYPASSSGADYFNYTITYKGHTVTTEDTGVPESLLPAIRELNDVISVYAYDYKGNSTQNNIIMRT